LAFRIVAAILIPLLVVGGLEAGLRLAGYGYPTSFFLRTKIAGQEFYVPNDRFGYRFFPPVLARTPVTMRVAVKKPANTFRIFLFGESAAMGDPEPSFGAGRYMETLLRARYPGVDFEVVCVAMTAIDSHVILPIARECARMDGDLWVIYMGNNEMVGPFGASTVFGSRVPPVSVARLDIALKATRIGQFFARISQASSNAKEPETWGGLAMFKENRLAYGDPNRLRAYANFRKNLADILKAGHSASVPVIVSTVGSNFKDCAPFASMHGSGFSDSHKSDWDRAFQDGVAFQDSGNSDKALQQFAQAAALDPRHAELEFRMGACDLALTNSSRAADEFLRSRDDDALDFRADSRVNQIIKETASAPDGAGAHLTDAVAMLAKNSANGITGNELFFDHVHLNFAGNYLLGRAFAEETSKLLPKSIQDRDKGQWADAETCDRRLAISPWDRYGVWQESFSHVSVPPFTDQSNKGARTRFYTSMLNLLRTGMNSDAAKESLVMYKDAVAAAPDDYFLRDNFAQFLSETGDLAQAVTQEEKVAEMLPQTPLPPFKIGLLLVQQGKMTEAAESFSRALAVRKDYAPALNELGVILANAQKTNEAAERFAQVLQINSGFVDTYLDWGFMEQSEGKTDQAMAHYLKASKLQPSGPPSYFYQGVLAAREHRREDAVKYFNAAAMMKPSFWQARHFLGMELAAAGKIEEAQAQFAEAVRTRPDFARGHLNNGVALAKERKFDAALKEFQEAARLNPADKIARQNLDAVQRDLRLNKGAAP
jgi:tetratricopeptide (TPR) repeat protein